MIDKLKKLTGLKLKEAIEILNKYPKYRYTFKVTKGPQQEARQITGEFRVLKVTEVDDGLVSILIV